MWMFVSTRWSDSLLSWHPCVHPAQTIIRFILSPPAHHPPFQLCSSSLCASQISNSYACLNGSASQASHVPTVAWLSYYEVSPELD